MADRREVSPIPGRLTTGRTAAPPPENLDESGVGTSNAGGGKCTRSDLFLLIAALVVVFWGLGDRGLWGSEGRWAQVTREMLRTGDYFHPTIGGEPYFDKPLLTYWLIAALARATGVLNAWIIRLPSALAGLVALWATVRLGRRLASPATARLAGWILLTCYAFLFWSRTAAADAENLAAITLCLLWYWTRRHRPGFVTFVVFYLIAFVGAHNKGLTAVAVPILAVLPDLATRGRWRALLRPAHFLALAIGLAVYLAPFLVAALTRPAGYESGGLALVFQENFLRYFHAFDHQQPFYIYFYAVPMLVLPWTPIFIAALIRMFAAWKTLGEKDRWLLHAIVVVFVFFTAAGSRRDYYILPIVPLCALLTAIFVQRVQADLADPFHRAAVRIQKGLLLALVLAQLLAPPALFIAHQVNGFTPPRQLYLAAGTLGLAALLAAFLADRLRLRTGSPPAQDHLFDSCVLTAAITMGGFFCWQFNLLDRLRTERPFALALQAHAAALPLERIALALKPDASATLLFYLDLPGNPTFLDFPRPAHQAQADPPGASATPGAPSADDAARVAAAWQQFFRPDARALLITQRRYARKIPAQFAEAPLAGPDLAEPSQPWEHDSTRGEKWIAWPLNVPPAPPPSAPAAAPAVTASGDAAHD